MEPFEKAFDQLRRDYLAESGARLAELRADADAYRAGDASVLAALRTRFHRLVGSGGSYGFPEISSAARQVERWLAGAPVPGPANADTLDDSIDRLAVLFSEAELMLRAALGGGANRLAVIAAPAGPLVDDLREVLGGAGFAARVLPPDARPEDVARADAVQLVVIAFQGNASFALAASWMVAPASSPRTIVLVEQELPVDRLRAAVAGVEMVLPAERAASELARLAQRHVLASAARFVAVLADDAPDRQDRLGDALRHLGVEVRLASDPVSAEQHLEVSIPDVVIVAASLPDGGGRALARLVRQDPRCVGVPVILLGAVSEEDRLAALREGVDEVLVGAREAGTVAAELRARAERGRRTRELVRRDPLTGALADASLRAELDHAVALARRDDRPLALLLATVDGLRGVNEEHGSTVGDRLLAHAASVLRGTVRQSDVVGRRGGRSFCVVLRGSSREGAGRIARKVEAAAADHPFEARDGGTIPLQFSLALAILGEDGATSDELLAAGNRS
jgi:diguanylate cyclase (GGDEF)-like protein